VWAWENVYRNALEGSIMSEQDKSGLSEQTQQAQETTPGTETTLDENESGAPLDTTTPPPDTGEAANEQSDEV
jgi:hypothetical protein